MGLMQIEIDFMSAWQCGVRARVGIVAGVLPMFLVRVEFLGDSQAVGSERGLARSSATGTG